MRSQRSCDLGAVSVLSRRDLGCISQFVASRSVMMAGKNVAKVGARLMAGGLSAPVALHAMQAAAVVAVMVVAGVAVVVAAAVLFWRPSMSLL